MRIETEKVYKLVKKYGGVLTDDRHFMDDVEQLLETAYNSDYAKCKNHDHDLKGSWEYRQCNRCGEYVAVG